MATARAGGTGFLTSLHLPTVPPPRAAARGPPLGEFDYAPASDDFDQRVPEVA